MPGSVPNALILKSALEEERVTVHTSLRGEWLGRGLVQQVTGGGMTPS